MYIIEKKLKDFSAAHRIIKGYQGQCRNLHGHNYSVQIKLGCSVLNEYDFVFDFSDIETHFAKWVTENLDHGVIISSDDTELIGFVQESQQKHYILPGDVNSSVETVAEHLYHTFQDKLKKIQADPKQQLQLLSVQVWETRYSSALYVPNE